MLKKEIEFIDFDGNPQTETHYFNLNKTELIEMEVTESFGDRLKAIVADNNPAVLIKEFKGIILASVGRRSEDGRRFIKSKEISDDFYQSPAYDALFMWIISDADRASEFAQGIMPNMDTPLVVPPAYVAPSIMPPPVA